MSDNLTPVIYKLGLCETVTDIRTVLQNGTDQELQNLKEFCKEIALNKMRKNNLGAKSTLCKATAENNTTLSRGEHKPIKPEDLDRLTKSIMIATGHPFYKTYQQRLNSFTFFNQWKYEHLVPGKTLAEAGFYNLTKERENNDKVCCCICGLVLAEWVKGDCPFSDHYRYNRNCQYIQSMQEMYPQVYASIKERQGQIQCDAIPSS